jgi:hypothetical protein
MLATSEEELANSPHVGSGEIAEMFDPRNPVAGGVVHAQCGLDRGWVVS